MKHYCDKIDRANITAEEWNNIYKENGFYGKGSGPGSRAQNNKKLIQWLQTFIVNNNIRSIVDIGCGDLQWMPLLLEQFTGPETINYTGIDCTEILINSHQEKYTNHTFICKDIFSDDFEHGGEYDLLLCKDVLQHNMNNPKAVIEPISNINSRYKMLITPTNGPGAGALIRHNFTNYTWITDYKSDERKSIYLNTNTALKC